MVKFITLLSTIFTIFTLVLCVVQIQAFNLKNSFIQQNITKQINIHRGKTVVEIKESKIFTNVELIESMKLGKHFGSRRFDEGLQRLRLFLADRGYLTPKISEPESNYNGNRLLVTIFVDEGIKYKFGKITVEGNNIFSSKQIIGFSGMVEGEIVNAM